MVLILLVSNCRLMAEVDVIPTPKFAKQGTEIYHFSNVSLDFSTTTRDSAALIELRRFFGKRLLSDSTHHQGGITIHARSIDHSGFMDSDIPANLGDSALSSGEGYVLLVHRQSIDILAAAKTGIFYAVTTLLQLIKKERTGYYVKQVAIADYPSMKMRGISDDISRGQISTMSNFKKIIRFLAMHKMNVYMPYIENEFAFKSFPGFSKGRDPLTSAQVAELDAYGKVYHVQIIPIFETLGHMEDVLRKPQFEKYAEFPGATCLNISSDSAFLFMKKLLTEIAPAFSSQYFNMAADESFDVGLGASKKLVDSLGIAQADAQYYIKLYKVLKSLGKKVMMYGDIILKNPQILKEIPKDIIIVDWHYGASFDYPSVKTLRDSGFDFVASPAVWNFTGPFPDFYNSYANIQNFTREADRAGALGVIVSSWNDDGGCELRELNYPGYAWGADCAWNPDSADPAHFETAFFHQFFETGSSLPRIAYELLSSLNNQITWEDFWRAPFLAIPDPDAALRVESIRATMPEVFALATEASRFAGANRQILGIYQLVARMNAYWADKVIEVNRMREIAGDSTLSSQEKSERIIEIEKTLLSHLARIRREYVRAYLRTNRRPMLQLIEERFDEQVAQLRSGTSQLLSGNVNYDQTLPSSFIYYPKSKPYTPGSFKVDSATFVKTIDLIGDVPANSEAQLIGDTYCKLFVNNKFVGEVKGRRTLTWDVEFRRVKLFKISKFMHRGRNTIVVQSANYDRNGSAGCNVYSVVGYDTLLTDSTWYVVKGIVPPQNIRRRKSVPAAAYDNGWIISAPDFSLNLKSWIER